MVTTKDMKSLFQNVNIKKAVGIDSIPPELVKVAAKLLCQPLIEAKNMCIKQNNFSNNSKVASVFALDKRKSHKYFGNKHFFKDIRKSYLKKLYYVKRNSCHLKFQLI